VSDPNDRVRWNANDYAAHSSEQQRWARELIAKLRLRRDECVLDIGCGDGKVTAEIAGLVPEGRVLGVDNSLEMIRLAQERYPSGCFPNLRFDICDAKSLPCRGEFDVVFSNAALHWVIDHRPVLDGIARSLRPGGRILLQMGGRGNARNMIEALEEVLRRPVWREYFQDFEFPYGFHEPEPYRLWLEASGLTPVRVELLPKEMAHDGRPGLVGWIRTTWLPYTLRVPESLRRQFIDEAVDSYLSTQGIGADVRPTVGMVRLEVEAVKPRD
jgi:trans-aconitate 2-methyltransferase